MRRVKSFFIVFAIVSFVILGSNLYAKHPLNYRDLLKTSWLGDLTISPSGNSIVFREKKLSYKDNRAFSNLYLYNVASKELIKLTNGKWSDFSPKFSNDPNELYFLSTREGKVSIWKINLKGGEALKFLEIPVSIETFEVSPSGRYIAFTAMGSPLSKTYREQVEFWKKDLKNPVKAHVSEKLFYRVWNYWRNGKYSILFLYDTKTKKIKQITHGYTDVPPADLGSPDDLEFSLDEEKLFFVMNPDKVVAVSTNNDIFEYTIKEEKLSKITKNKANDNYPIYVRKNKKESLLIFRSMKRPGFEADKYYIRVYSFKTGEITEYLDSKFLSPSQIVVSKNPNFLYFTTAEKGYYPLYRFDFKRKKAYKIIDKAFIKAFVLSKNERYIYYIKESVNYPTELYRFDLKKKNEAQLTNFNSWMKDEIYETKLKEYWFSGANGDKVHMFVLLPPKFKPTKKWPAVFLIHGGPQGMWGDDFHPRWNSKMFASRGYVVIMINFHGSSGYGQDFKDSVSRDWGGKPFKDILLGFGYVVKNFKFIDPDRIGAAGASYGGYMIDWIEGHFHKFKALVSHAGVYDLRSMYGATEELWFPEWEFSGTPWTNPQMYEKHSPSNYVKNFKTPCLVIAGEGDYRVPYTQSLQFFTALQRMGVPSKLIVFPDETHFVQKPKNAEFWWNEVLGWLDKYLKK